MQTVQKSNLGYRQMPYYLVFVKISILLSVALYMALSGFLAYMFIKQQVGENVEDMEKSWMAIFLSFLSCFFFVLELILFFGFVAVSKQNLKMTIAFALLMTLMTAITLFLGAPTAIVFTGLITCLSWWFVVLLNQVRMMAADSEQQPPTFSA